MVVIQASITIEEGTSHRKYKRKYDNKFSLYEGKYKRAFLRITSYNFVMGLSKIDKINNKVGIEFKKQILDWKIIIKRVKENGVTLQNYCGSHPYIQVILNKSLPDELWMEYELNNKKTYTRSVNVEFNLDEWKDINLKPSDFLINVEKESKSLLDFALKNRFSFDQISKGRNYDLELIGPRRTKFLISVSTYGKESIELRRKEKIVGKILRDISKLLVYSYNRKVIPVVVTLPVETKKTWSFTTNDYLNFYKENFNFKFINTNFKKGWEKEVCKELLKLDKEN